MLPWTAHVRGKGKLLRSVTSCPVPILSAPTSCRSCRVSLTRTHASRLAGPQGRILAEGEQQEWRRRAALFRALQRMEADVRFSLLLSSRWRNALYGCCPRAIASALDARKIRRREADVSFCSRLGGTSGFPKSASTSTTRRASGSKKPSSRRSERATPQNAKPSRRKRRRKPRASASSACPGRRDEEPREGRSADARAKAYVVHAF